MPGRILGSEIRADGRVVMTCDRRDLGRAQVVLTEAARGRADLVEIAALVYHPETLGQVALSRDQQSKREGSHD